MGYRQKHLLWLGLRSYIGLLKNQRYRRAKAEYKRSLGYPVFCWLCDKKVKKKSLTIDHAIPKEVCYEIGRPLLVYDQRNFMPAHKECNHKRGTDISVLPASVIKKIAELRG